MKNKRAMVYHSHSPVKWKRVHLMYRKPLQSQEDLYKPCRLLDGTDFIVGSVHCTGPSMANDGDGNENRGKLVASPS